MARYYTSFEFAEIETLNDWNKFYSENQNSFDGFPIKDDNFVIPTKESDFPIYLEGHYDEKKRKRLSVARYWSNKTLLYWTKATKEQFEKHSFLDYRFHESEKRQPSGYHFTIFEKNLC